MIRAIAWFAMLLIVGACKDLPPAPPPPDDPDPPEELVPGEVRPLHFETYDGSGQVVHPDVPSLAAAGITGEQLLVLTPYPYGDETKENPSVFGSTDPLGWHPVKGVRNPVAVPRAGYLSDPDLVFDPATGRYDLYYRRVDEENEIFRAESVDGVTWSPPVRVAHGPNHEIVSPAVVRRGDGDWFMWSVNAGRGCAAPATRVELRRSPDGIAWSSPQPVQLDQPGYSAWHIDVQWIPARAEFWAVYNVKTPGTCATTALYLATSVDGVHWQTHPAPVLAAGASRAFEDIVYRSTFAYDPSSDVITLWYSGARYTAGEYVWSAAVQQRTRTELFASIAQALPASGTRRHALPPLLHAP